MRCKYGSIYSQSNILYWINAVNYKNLKKYLKAKRSIFDNFSSEILYLHREGATQKSILKFLIDHGLSAKQSNLSRWLSRQNIVKTEMKDTKRDDKNKAKNIETNIFKNLK